MTELKCIFTSVYLKSEADKVIEELKHDVEMWTGSFDAVSRVNARTEIKLRHSNYKRCLAMAERYEIEYKLARYLAYNSNKEIKAHKRWQKWLELAEQFKER